MRAAVLESITNCKYKTIDINIYKGDNSLRKSSTDYIDLVYRVFNEDYKHIVDMEEIAEQSFDEMQAYLLLQEKVNEKLKTAADNMENANRQFAKKYNINLVSSSDELSEKLATASKLNAYRNKVFLLFFKCNWQDNFLTQSVNNKKVKDMESKSDHTKQEVDTYNKAVKEINAAVNTFNQRNKTPNEGRNRVLQSWNNTDKAFADQHMPVYRR